MTVAARNGRLYAPLSSRAPAIVLLTAQALSTVIQQGQNAFRVKDWPRAEWLFSEAVRAQPMSAPALDRKEPDACYYWGRTVFSLSRFEAALRAYEKNASD